MLTTLQVSLRIRLNAASLGPHDKIPMKKTTYLYILREIIPISLIGLMTFTVILLMDKIFRLIELIVNKGGDVGNILMLLVFIAPSFFTFTIPISLLLGILLALGRFSGDSEIIAFKASGISLYQLFIPISVLSITAFFITSFMVFYGLPWGNRGFMSTLYLIAQSKADLGIKERVFNALFNGLVVYVDKIPIQGKKMEGILIYDERDKNRISTIFAKEGFLDTDPTSQELVLTLLHGDLHRFEPKTKVYQKMKFDTYDLKVEIGKTIASIENKLKEHEMSVDEIKKRIAMMKEKGEDTTSLEVGLHKRYTIPFACIVFGLIGVPLGVQPRRSARSYGFVLSIFILLGYYVSLIAFELLAVKKAIPAIMAGWLPTFLFGGLGIYLLIKAANESPFKPAIWVAEALDFLQRKMEKGF
jgi:lipopolysaccharide export system permease protein